MTDLRPEDSIHKSYLNRLLIEIIDNPVLAGILAFKGGTCAAMLGYLDRFSVDLDFDVLKKSDEAIIRQEMIKVFDYLNLEVVRQFDRILMWQVKYPSSPGKRNTLKVSVNSQIIKNNSYKVQYLAEIDRLMNCQTIDTMFAYKLVAIWERYNLHQVLAGRDLYDIHHFLVQGYSIRGEVVSERTGMKPELYLEKLTGFIREKINQTVIDEDLNTLLPDKQFQQIRKVLIPETLTLLSKVNF